jgi:CubicO group peptidase (beta-lactamase class C family)
MPAMAAAVVTRDSVVFVDAVGVRKLGDPAPATRDDRFHLGSNTKAPTAGLVGLLVDEGKLAWTAPLAAAASSCTMAATASTCRSASSRPTSTSASSRRRIRVGKRRTER